MSQFAVSVGNMTATVSKMKGRCLAEKATSASRTHAFLWQSANASMTVPRANRLLLMYLPSANRSTSDAAFSLPAKSINVYVRSAMKRMVQHDSS